jgi:hypothetical protein
MVYAFVRRFLETLAPAHRIAADELTAAELAAILDHLRTFPEDDYVVTRRGERFAAFVSPGKFSRLAVQTRAHGIGLDHRQIVGYAPEAFARDLPAILAPFERGRAHPVMIMPGDDPRDAVAVLISLGSAAGE